MHDELAVHAYIAALNVLYELPANLTHTSCLLRFRREQKPGPSTPRKFQDMPLLYKFVLPSTAIGPLMGHNGCHLEQIRKDTGCLVQVSRPGHATMTDRDRVVAIGAPTMAAAVAAAHAMLLTIEREGAIERLRKAQTPGKIYLKMVIPAGSAGKVLGPGGETILEICSRSRCSVVVEGKPVNAAFVPFRYVTFLCSTVEQTSDALALVMDLVSQDERYYQGIKDIQSVAFRVIEVPEKRVGAILGQGGLHIQALQSMLTCKIGVADTSEKKGTRFVSVWGPPAMVRIAVDVVIAAAGTPSKPVTPPNDRTDRYMQSQYDTSSLKASSSPPSEAGDKASVAGDGASAADDGASALEEAIAEA